MLQVSVKVGTFKHFLWKEKILTAWCLLNLGTGPIWLLKTLFCQVDNIIVLTDYWLSNYIDWSINNYRKDVNDSVLVVKMFLSGRYVWVCCFVCFSVYNLQVNYSLLIKNLLWWTGAQVSPVTFPSWCIFYFTQPGSRVHLWQELCELGRIQWPIAQVNFSLPISLKRLRNFSLKEGVDLAIYKQILDFWAYIYSLLLDFGLNTFYSKTSRGVISLRNFSFILW